MHLILTYWYLFKVLQKAGHHMEDTLIAAYTALLTGYCIMEDEVQTKLGLVVNNWGFSAATDTRAKLQLLCSSNPGLFVRIVRLRCLYSYPCVCFRIVRLRCMYYCCVYFRTVKLRSEPCYLMETSAWWWLCWRSFFGSWISQPLYDINLLCIWST